MTIEATVPESCSGTHIHYYYICRRKLWLFAHALTMEYTSEAVSLGRLVHETSYKRGRKEISAPGMKIDLLENQEGSLVVGEIKKSSHSLQSAKMQLVYYLWRLRKMGLEAKGELLIPKERKRIRIELTDELENALVQAIEDIVDIMNLDTPPGAVSNRFCRNCAYREFCWV